MIEVLLIVVVLSLVLCALVPFVFYTHDTLEDTQEQKDVLTIENALKLYKIDNGMYPTNEQGLDALTIQPTTEPVPKQWIQYLPVVPVDLWGRPYQYTLDENTQKILVISCEPEQTEQSFLYRLFHFFSEKKPVCNQKPDVN